MGFRTKSVHRAFKRRSVDERFALKTYKGNHIYYASVQKASNKRLISVQLEKLKSFLEARSVHFNPIIEQEINNSKGEGDNFVFEDVSISQIEHLKLNTSIDNFTDSEIKSLGWSEEDVKQAQEELKKEQYWNNFNAELKKEVENDNKL